jgi:hypothetical protein
MQVPEAGFLQQEFAPGVSLTLGENLAPRGELKSLGGMFTPLITPRLQTM